MEKMVTGVIGIGKNECFPLVLPYMWCILWPFETVCFNRGLLSPQALSSSKEKYPIFTFVEGQGQDYGLEGHSSNHSGPAAHILPPGKLGRSNNRRNSDEFVFL